MALNSTDLFVIQSQADSKLYKVSLNDLSVSIEAGPGINFRGSVDLLVAMSGQISPDPALNGDLYLVEQDAATIDGSWPMAGGVTSAITNDRIVWDQAATNWLLVSAGDQTGGTLVDIVGTDPIQIDSVSDPIIPVISIDLATTTEKGAVDRLATAADVIATNATPSSTAVVTADLLNATNKVIENGVVSSITEGGADIVAGALDIDNVDGDVTIGINTETFCPYSFSSLTDITA